uniref:Small ribosomal subunit protein bS18c n=1 Tax=Juncus fauriei TaxID=2980169 RepID=A0AAU7AMZ3_9POAL
MRSRKLIDSKNIKLLHRFIGYQGKIIPRRVSKVAFAVQRLLSAAIKKARILALLPFVENKKHSQKVRMLKQRIQEKKGKKIQRKVKKKKILRILVYSKWKRQPDPKKKDKGTAKPGKTPAT